MYTAQLGNSIHYILLEAGLLEGLSHFINEKDSQLQKSCGITLAQCHNLLERFIIRAVIGSICRIEGQSAMWVIEI